MERYHKIQTVYKRDPKTNFKTLLLNEFSLPEFEYLRDNSWVFTEKVDGTNIRVIWNGNDFIDNFSLEFRGKTNNAQLSTQLINVLPCLFNKERMQEIFSRTSVCLYGEGYGAKIQKGGGKYRADQSFVLFDIKIEDFWLQRKDIEDIAQKLNIEIVPIIGIGTLTDMISIVRKGFNSDWGDFIAEGIVAKPQIELKTRSGQRIITKIKHKDFQCGDSLIG